MNDEEFLSVAEFALARGVSKQAVYQQLNKGLKDFVQVLNGKKYIRREALSAFGSSGFNQVEQAFSSELNQAEQAEIERLQAQIAERDKQISSLLERLQGAQEQNTKLLTLLEQAQEINKNNQILIARAQETPQLPSETETKRKGLFGLFKRQK